LACFLTKRVGVPVSWLTMVAIGTPPSSRPPRRSASTGSRGAIAWGYAEQQSRLGFEEVLVEVLRGDLTRPQGERSGQAADGIDVRR
jgi:hypothetical protein